KGMLVVNGEQAWFKEEDRVEEAPKDIVPFVRDLLYAMRMPQLLPALQDAAFKLSPLGEVQVGDRPAVGLSIAHKDHKDVSLFFDKENGLPVKSEVRLTDPQGKEVTIEYLYSDYKDFAGLKHPAKVMIKGVKGVKELTMEFSELKPEEKLDDGLFAKP